MVFASLFRIHFTLTLIVFPLLSQIKIMQEYGEVVCIVGSSASAYNCAIFMQADARYAKQRIALHK